MRVAMEVLTVLQFNQEQVVTTQTAYVTTLLMPSMTITRKIQRLLAVYLEELHNLPTLTQVRYHIFQISAQKTSAIEINSQFHTIPEQVLNGSLCFDISVFNYL
jgi:hypothetical protein